MGILSENEIGKKVKISCSGMSEGSKISGYDSSNPDEVVKIAASHISMSAVQNGSMEVTGNNIERLSRNSIVVMSPAALFNNKDGTRGHEDRNNFTKKFVHELMHLIAGDVHGEHEAAIACSTMCELTTSKGKASDSSKYLCALSNEEAETAELIGGQHKYLRYLADVLTVNSPSASPSPLTGVLHSHDHLRYVQNYLYRHSPELFNEITQNRKNRVQLYRSKFLNFFRDDPNFENLKSGKPIVDYGYDPNNVSEVHKYIIARVFSGEDFEDVKDRLRDRLFSKEDNSEDDNSELDLMSDFFLWLNFDQ
jgi:hypothetical protein